MKISVEFERDNSYHDKWYVGDSSSILVTGGGTIYGDSSRDPFAISNGPLMSHIDFMEDDFLCMLCIAWGWASRCSMSIKLLLEK